MYLAKKLCEDHQILLNKQLEVTGCLEYIKSFQALATQYTILGLITN